MGFFGSLAKGAALGFGLGGAGGALTGVGLAGANEASGGQLGDAFRNFAFGPQTDLSQIGVPGFEDRDKQIQDFLAQGSRFQGQQDALLSQLGERAAGQGDVAAINDIRRQATLAQNQQQGLAAAQAGNPAAARQAAQNIGNLQRGATQAAGQARLQDQVAAQAALNNALSSFGGLENQRLLGLLGRGNELALGQGGLEAQRAELQLDVDTAPNIFDRALGVAGMILGAPRKQR